MVGDKGSTPVRTAVMAVASRATARIRLFQLAAGGRLRRRRRAAAAFRSTAAVLREAPMAGGATAESRM